MIDYDTVQIQDLTLPFFIGVHDFEKFRPQNVSISLEMRVPKALRRGGGYVSYADVADEAIALSQSGAHIKLVETLASRLMAKAFEAEPVAYVRISVLKRDIYPQAGGVGVVLESSREQFEAEGA